jgi:predicted proteasome-type protease
VIGKKIKRREADELRILAIASIADATELLAGAIRNITPRDIDAAIEHAVDLFANRRAPAAQAIAGGIRHAKSRIQHRQALQLCAWILLAGAKV